MHVAHLHMHCIFFLASLTLSYSRHISFDIDDVNGLVSPKGSCGGVCMTPGCVKAAARVISAVDENVDPCNNFYQFACGSWLSNNDIPEGKHRWGLFSELDHDVRKKLKALVEKELDGTEPAFVKMLRDIYDSCIDLETIDKLGSEPLKKDLASLGGWPLVEGSQWDESTFDWVDTMIAFRRSGYHFTMLVDPYVGKEKENSTIHIIQLLKMYFGIEKDNLKSGLNDSEIADRYKAGVKEAVLLGADEDTAEKELLQALEFQLELAKIAMTEEEEKEDNELEEDKEGDEKEEEKEDGEISTEFTPNEFRYVILPEKEKKKERKRRYVESTYYNIYTVSELQNLVPEIPWLKLFNGVFNDEIGEDENILVYDPVYLKKLASLLEKTDKRVVANYMFWKAVNAVRNHLSKEWREINKDQSFKDESSEDESRWKKCFLTVSDRLEVALNSYYIRHHFQEDSKNAVLELIKYIHRELLRILENSDWMDDQTKKNAIEKANSMKTLIGYPNELLNDTAIMDIYESLKISNESYYRNILSLQKWETDYRFSSLRKTDVEMEWIKYADASMVNAFYNPTENLIGFPAGILQGGFFDKDRPHYMNFAAVGSVIGHEITHGFDNKGKQYDKDGNKVDWWDKTTDELFHQRVQCMIHQYGNYTLESGLKVNGEHTQGENIADNGGIKEAYRAYHTWVRDHGPEPLLPGIKYNQKQLFWISAASVWCSKISKEMQERLIKYDPHSPAEFRVIGPMSNFVEFSADFNCAPGTPMNKEEKCHVW